MVADERRSSTISPEAQQKVLEVRSAEPDPETLALWVEVNGEANGAYTYLMEFRPAAELDDDVLIQHHDDVTVAIPGESVECSRGADARRSQRRHGDAEPEPPAAAGRAVADRPEADLSGEVPQR